ncbi:MAG: DEAD/DEAH box helicase family protein, partial [FCB group bacterium]|nr:DEAD/DEAH box helicase family protein [FCB group bacterium]
MADSRINVAIAGPYHNLFTYKIRSDDAADLIPGCRFLVPFGKSLKVAFYVEGQTEPVDYRLRYIKERIDTDSPFPTYLFDFCRWISEYYFSGLGETLAAALPGSGTRKPKLEYAAADRGYLQIACDSEKTDGVLAAKLLRRQSVSEKVLIRDKESATIVREWLARGIIVPRHRQINTRKKSLGYRLLNEHPEANAATMEHLRKIRPDMIYSRQQLLSEFGFTTYQITKLCKDDTFRKVFDESGVTELSTYPIRYDLPGLKLLEGQQQALDQITPAIDEGRFEPFLLFGITGSGKTMVYCHAAKRAVEAGRSVLVMVPEIALSGMLLSSFAAFFGDRVAVMHSGLTASQRQIVRHKIASGEIKVVIGPRSAIFAPLAGPGLIIVDEEHDPSYKQDDPAPRYHGRDAAVMLANKISCPVILGSASPGIESYHNARSGRYKLLTLDQRPKSGYIMPEIVTLD